MQDSETWVHFNTNHFVRVHLRASGVEHMRTIFTDSELDQLYPQWRAGLITLQFWDCMRIFGSMMSLGCDPPFETGIELHFETMRELG